MPNSPYGGLRRSEAASIVEGIHRRARDGEVVITRKALEEIQEINLQKEDVLDILLHLETSEYLGGLRSRLTGDWMHTFRTWVTMTAIYIKVILRESCIVISFHIDRGEDGTEDF